MDHRQHNQPFSISPPFWVMPSNLLLPWVLPRVHFSPGMLLCHCILSKLRLPNPTLTITKHTLVNICQSLEPGMLEGLGGPGPHVNVQMISQDQHHTKPASVKLNACKSSRFEKSSATGASLQLPALFLWLSMIAFILAFLGG